MRPRPSGPCHRRAHPPHAHPPPPTTQGSHRPHLRLLPRDPPAPRRPHRLRAARPRRPPPHPPRPAVHGPRREASRSLLNGLLHVQQHRRNQASPNGRHPSADAVASGGERGEGAVRAHFV